MNLMSFVVLEVKRVRVVDGTYLDLLNRESMKEIDRRRYNYMRVLQMDNTFNDRMKSQIREQYVRPVKNIFDLS